MFKRNKRPREKLEGKEALIVGLIMAGIVLIGILLPLPSVRVVSRLSYAAVIAVIAGLIYRTITIRRR